MLWRIVDGHSFPEVRIMRLRLMSDLEEHATGKDVYENLRSTEFFGWPGGWSIVPEVSKRTIPPQCQDAEEFRHLDIAAG
jgi:hypothetical protein